MTNLRPSTLAPAAVAVLLVGTVGACSASPGGGEVTPPPPSPSTTSPTPSGSATPAPSGSAVIDPGDGGDYHPVIDPAEFSAVVDNPFFPLPVGATWHYQGLGAESDETDTVVVTRRIKTIMGVPCVVVHDVVRSGGQVTEDTYDWYSQHSDGSVWYFGEQVTEHNNGKLSTAGSWEAGVDGAQPGILMPAQPEVGHAYRQEFLEGEAEDLAEVTAVGATVHVGSTVFTDVVLTKEWTPLEAAVVDEKAYVAGLGTVRERSVAGPHAGLVLVEFRLG